jgi:hypothetical protein
MSERGTKNKSHTCFPEEEENKNHLCYRVTGTARYLNFLFHAARMINLNLPAGYGSPPIDEIRSNSQQVAARHAEFNLNSSVQ